jgi:hypothetical protein
MEQSVEDSCDNYRVVEDPGPLLKRPVARHDAGLSFLVDDLFILISNFLLSHTFSLW